MGNPPEAYDGNPKTATAFWNALSSYYSVNAALFTTEGLRVAAALSHFKLGTEAGDWASERMETALARNPIDYGTWDDFKNAFAKQFIPPQIKAEAISKMYTTAMGSRPFNEWYLEWSGHARRADVDDRTKIWAFRKNLNSAINAKIIGVSPQPATLDDLVKLAREFDAQWRTFAGPLKSNTPRRQPRIRELADDATAEINAAQGRPSFRRRGKLTPQERKHRMDNNLCLYCGKPGHKATECTAPPNRRPRPGSRPAPSTLRQVETNDENARPTSDDGAVLSALGTMRLGELGINQGSLLGDSMVRSNPLGNQRRPGGDLPSILEDDNDTVMQDDPSFSNIL
jgi:hypothetical protein